MALVKTGKAFGVKTEAVISDMNQPLGKFVGNALEVYECVKILRGEATTLTDEPTLELSLELAARMLVLTGIARPSNDCPKAKFGKVRMRPGVREISAKYRTAKRRRESLRQSGNLARQKI